MFRSLIERLTGKKPPHIEVFQGDDGQWRTRIRAANGEIEYQDEGFSSESNAWRKARTFSFHTNLKVKETA